MKGYVIAGVTVTDQATYERYRAGVLPTVERHGGRFLVRGGAMEPREGSWRPKRIVILEFPSLDAARTWYDSAEYQALAALRQQASESDLVLVEGAPPV